MPTTFSCEVMMLIRSMPRSSARSGVEENTEMTDVSIRSRATIRMTLSPLNPSIQFQMLKRLFSFPIFRFFRRSPTSSE